MAINWNRVAEAVGLAVLVGASVFVVVDRKHLFEKREHPMVQAVQQHKLAPVPQVPDREHPRQKTVQVSPKYPIGDISKKLPSGNKPPVYHRVLPGGRQDGVMTCAKLKSLTGGVPESVIEQYARQYGISEHDVRALKECYDH